MTESSFPISIVSATDNWGYTLALRAAVDSARGGLSRVAARPSQTPTLLVIGALPPGEFPDRWFDLTWAVPQLGPAPDPTEPCEGSVSAAEFWDTFEPDGWHVIDRIGHLPPPPRIPGAERASAPEAFDWAPLAERLCTVADSLTPPKLDPIDRVRIASGRLASARCEVDDARRSVCALARNAIAAGVPKTAIAHAAGVSRPTLDAWLAGGDTGLTATDVDA